MKKNKQEVSNKQIEKLTKDCLEFIKNNEFEVMNEYELLTRLEKVLFECIDKHYK